MIGTGWARRDGATANCCRISGATNVIRAGKASTTAASASSRFPICATTTRRPQPGSKPASSSDFRAIPDFNGETTYGVGSYQLGIGRHWRTSSASAFLKPVAHRPNLTVITDAQVSKVTFRGDVATGVEWVKNARTFSADRGPRGYPVSRCVAVAATAPIVRRRPGRSVARAWHPSSCRLAGSRAQSAGSLSGTADCATKAADLAERPSAQSRRACQDGLAMDVRRQRPVDSRCGAGRRRSVHRIRRRRASRRTVQRHAVVGRQAR